MNKKSFQVWHDIRRANSVILDPDKWVPSPNFPEGYTHVANVHAESINEAWAATSNGGSFTWGTDHGRNAFGIDVLCPAGPTNVGDVIVDPTGVAYRLDDKGSRSTVAWGAEPAQSDYDRALDEAARRGSNESPERGGPER